MNRKERRAAQRLGGGPAAGPVGRAQQLLFEAVQQHQAGRLVEAERAYRGVLALDPNNARCLYNLGILALQTGRSELAAEWLSQAVTLHDRDPEWHYNLGYATEQAGRNDQAAASYRRALDLRPDYAEAAVNLGNVLLALNRLREAADCYRRAIALRPDVSDLHYNLGNVLARQGKLDEAIASLRRALTLKPSADVHNSLGNVLMQDAARLDEALQHYRQALALDRGHIGAQTNIGLVHLIRGEAAEAAALFSRIAEERPDDADAHENLAQALLAAGDAAAALSAVVQALKLRESARARSLFVTAIKQVRTESDQPVLREFLLRALNEGWGRAGDLADVAADVIKAVPAIARLIERVFTACPESAHAFDLFQGEDLVMLASEPLLVALLQSARNTDLDLERLLTAARSALLARALLSATEPELVLRLRAALAQQCFINDYVFAVDETDARAGEALRKQVYAALAGGGSVEPGVLLTLASFESLQGLPQPQRLLETPHSEAVSAVLRQQIAEPREENELRGTIARLTPTADEVSRAVQAQYEENPYPRWVKAPQPRAAMTFNERLRALFPLVPFRPIENGSTPDILIAGCGTGQHSIEIARQYPQARILAIDLSAASLAYAMRKTRESGIENIEYAQADILELGQIGRSFDVIESSGVLHHLVDPFAGGRVLASLLRPGGFLFLGLYSAIARQNIVKARALIAERGYRPTAADIRRCRQDLIRIVDDPALNAVKASSDFFTISDCRDLLFHVQEHRLTLPEIANFLAEIGVEFLGFELSPNVRRAYAARFPDDKTLTDLACWQEFENENPATFAGMYQFWAQRAA